LDEVLDLFSIFAGRALELHYIDDVGLQQLLGLVLVRHAQLLFLLGDICHVGGFRISEGRETIRLVGLRFRALGGQAIFGSTMHIQKFILRQNKSGRPIFLEEEPV
jgi:hypothetical protein